MDLGMNGDSIHLRTETRVPSQSCQQSSLETTQISHFMISLRTLTPMNRAKGKDTNDIPSRLFCKSLLISLCVEFLFSGVYGKDIRIYPSYQLVRLTLHNNIGLTEIRYAAASEPGKILACMHTLQKSLEVLE